VTPLPAFAEKPVAVFPSIDAAKGAMVSRIRCRRFSLKTWTI